MKDVMVGFCALALVIGLLLPGAAHASSATEQEKQAAIDAGLAWLASTQQGDGSWTYTNNGTLAATGSAALAFIEEGYLPGDGSIYDAAVTNAVDYIFARATPVQIGWETAVYPRHAEDYNNDGILNDGGNNQGIYFNPGQSSRSVYTTGVVAPVVGALGNALGSNTLVGGTSAVASMSYRQVMRDVVDWYSWGQVEPDRGNYRGGWRYDVNYSSSDNSTAQWGALTMLYGQAWGLDTPQYVKDELNLWATYIQHGQDGSWMAGGSGYSRPDEYVNMSKTAGLLLELASMGVPKSDIRVQNALAFINSRWNVAPYGTWYGNINHPYAMWGVYKALEVYGVASIPNAPGGVTIGQDWDPQLSDPGDWYSHYCGELVGLQNTDGSWTGYTSYFTGPLATGWYINILNAAGVPEQVIPEPLTMLGVLAGISALGGYLRKRRTA